MKIEVGMKLTVRKDIKNMNSNTLFVNEEMEAMAGAIVMAKACIE